VGGPLFIPGVYNQNKQKTFFFWNEEWRKILSGAGTNEQGTIDPGDLPSSGSDLSYVIPAFTISSSTGFGNQLVTPNIQTSNAYWTTGLGPSYANLASLTNPTTGAPLVPNQCWVGYYDTWDPAPTNTTPSPAYHHCFTAMGVSDPGHLATQVIPHGLFDNNGILYLNSPIFPKPNVAGQDKNIANNSNPIDVRDDVVRVDHKVNDKWQILGHYMHDSVTQGYAAPELGWLWASYNTVTSTLSNPSNSAALKLSGTINPNLLIEASLNYDGNIINIVNSASGNYSPGWAINPVAASFAITRKSFPGMNYMGPYGVAEDTGSAPWHNAAEDYEPKVDVSYTAGKHAMKFGFSYNRYTKNQQLFGDEQGYYSPSGTTNDSLMDLLLGLTGGYSQYQAVPIRHYVNQTPSAYVMDNWHMTPRLSLQLGLRYDALPHAWERQNEVANFNPAAYNQTAAPVWTNSGTIDTTSAGISTVNSVQYYLNGMGLAGVQGFPHGLVVNDYKTLQPRVGFSEDIFGNGKTVLRGGFGTFFERMQGNDIYNAATNPPFAYNLGLGNTYLTNPGTNWQSGNGISGFPVFAAGVTNLAQNYRAPAVAQFSLGVQHEIKPSVIWVVQYVGNLAWHQNIEKQINNLPSTVGSVNPLTGATTGAGIVPLQCLVGDSGNHSPFGDDTACKPGLGNAVDGVPTFPGGLNQFRSYQGYTGITSQENDTNGNYTGFQTGLRLQNKWGLSGELDYTWSHEIDITSYDLSGISNPWNPKYDKGSGALDRRQMLNANYVYKLPFFNKGADLTHSILGGWEIAGTFIDESGLIGTVTGAGGVLGSGNGYDPVGLGGGYTVRPNISGKMDYPKKWNNYFDTSKFSNVVPVWQGGSSLGFGNTGKDAVVGPGRVNFTTSLYKSFSVTERAHFELRFESFNTFNHAEGNGINTGYAPQNGAFSTKFNSGNTFGQITSAWDARVLELGGKFVF